MASNDASKHAVTRMPAPEIALSQIVMFGGLRTKKYRCHPDAAGAAAFARLPQRAHASGTKKPGDIEMTHVLRNLLCDEERASNVIIWGCGAVCAVCFLTSLVAMAVLR